MKIFAVLFLVSSSGFCQIPNGAGAEEAGPVCLLELDVVSAEGGPAHLMLVELIDSEGRVVRSVKSEHGRARFCDVDFGIYSVRAGGNRCHPTSIGQLRMRPDDPQRLRVVVNLCNYVKDHRNFCTAYLRVSSAGGAVGYPEVWRAGSSRPLVGDSYGRVMFHLQPGQVRRVEVGGRGFERQAVELACQDVEDVERRVVLSASGPG